MTRSRLTIAGLMIMALLLAACGSEAGGAVVDTGQDDDTAIAGMCAQDQPECVDTPELNDDEPVPIDEHGLEQLRRDAQYYLGKKENELNELIRVARIGDEHQAVTDDYVVGRITVELDDIDGELIVTSSTVELPDGPETFTLDE